MGAILPAIRTYELRQVDELIFLDIGCERPDFDLIGQIADELFCPLTVGGGIRSIDDIRTILAVGADKVSIRTAAVVDPAFISRAAEKFGSQAIVRSIDVDPTAPGFSIRGVMAAKARRAEKLGAGEILLQSIDRDGMMMGYDLPLIEAVSDAVRVPVVACSGAGCPQHFAEALAAGASAVAAASVFLFTEETPHTVKTHLAAQGVPVRL